jgi:hypothetical protein
MEHPTSPCENFKIHMLRNCRQLNFMKTELHLHLLTNVADLRAKVSELR